MISCVYKNLPRNIPRQMFIFQITLKMKICSRIFIGKFLFSKSILKRKLPSNILAQFFFVFKLILKKNNLPRNISRQIFLAVKLKKHLHNIHSFWEQSAWSRAPGGGGGGGGGEHQDLSPGIRAVRAECLAPKPA